MKFSEWKKREHCEKVKPRISKIQVIWKRESKIALLECKFILTLFDYRTISSYLSSIKKLPAAVSGNYGVNWQDYA